MKLGEAGRKSCDKLLSEDCEINGKFQRRRRCLEATESHVCEEEVRPVREIKKEGKIKSRKISSRCLKLKSSAARSEYSPVRSQLR